MARDPDSAKKKALYSVVIQQAEKFEGNNHGKYFHFKNLITL